MKLLLATLLTAFTASAADVLVWPANNKSERITSYSVYGTTGGTNQLVKFATVKTNEWAISNLVSGDYLFFVTARNARGESIKSTPVLIQVP